MKIYVMRHGRTNWNEKWITQGRSQNMLSKTGKAEAMEVAKNFADTKIDVIVCSPLKRTVQTANLMNQYHNVKIIKDLRIIEIDQGVFTGQPYCKQTETEREAKRLRLDGYGLETYSSVYQRMQDFIRNIKKDYPYENVLIITHETPAIYLSAILSNLPINTKDPFSICRYPNAEIRSFEI